MKKIFLALMLALATVGAQAQITAPVVEEKPETDARYLAGAVPEENGQVYLTRTIDVPASLSQAEVMQRLDAWLTRCTKDERMLSNQRLTQPAANVLHHNCVLELTFSKSFISHDFANINYVIVLTAQPGKVTMEMKRITYKYNDGNKMQKYSGEELISDKYALNKKGRLIYGYKKFRMKTIDLMDELAVSLQGVF